MDTSQRIIALIISIICILLGKIGYMYEYSVYTPNMNHIIDNIYLGNWYDSTNWNVLKQKGITHILTLNKKMSHTENQLVEMKSNGITNMFIYIDDNEN